MSRREGERKKKERHSKYKVYEFSVLYSCHNQKEIYVERVDTEQGGEELERRRGTVSLAPDVMILKNTYTQHTRTCLN